jgi:hypothetical protein
MQKRTSQAVAPESKPTRTTPRQGKSTEATRGHTRKCSYRGPVVMNHPLSRASPGAFSPGRPRSMRCMSAASDMIDI